MKSSASERLIGSIQIEAFAHATEDPSRVKEAILNVAPGLDAEIRIENLRGHYDNPILLLRLRTVDEEQVAQILAALRGKLDGDNKKVLLDELERHLDERGTLYLRLDKQELYRGRLVINNGDDVVKMRFNLAPHLLRKYRIEEVYRLSGLTA